MNDVVTSQFSNKNNIKNNDDENIKHGFLSPIRMIFFDSRNTLLGMIVRVTCRL